MNKASQEKLHIKIASLINGIYQSFPTRLYNLVVISEDRVIYTSPHIEQIFTRNDLNSTALVNTFKKIMRENDACGWAENEYSFKNQNPHQDEKSEAEIKVISLDVEKIYRIYGLDTKNETYLISTLIHEVAHLVIEQAFPQSDNDEHLAECLADVYSLAKCMNLYGNNASLSDVFNTSKSIVLGLSPNHYTNPATEEFKKLYPNTDDLSEEAIARITLETVEKHKLSPNELSTISSAFSEVAEYYKKKCNFNDANKRKLFSELLPNEKKEMFKKCLRVMVQHQHDYNIYQAGKLFLSLEENTFGIKPSQP